MIMPGSGLRVVQYFASARGHAQAQFGVFSQAESGIEGTTSKHSITPHAEIAGDKMSGTVVPTRIHGYLRKHKRVHTEEMCEGALAGGPFILKSSQHGKAAIVVFAL